ncbi:hypothetical protein GCM10028833_33180 [Glycomyces tarimensis]
MNSLVNWYVTDYSTAPWALETEKTATNEACVAYSDGAVFTVRGVCAVEGERAALRPTTPSAAGLASAHGPVV